MGLKKLLPDNFQDITLPHSPFSIMCLVDKNELPVLVDDELGFAVVEGN